MKRLQIELPDDLHLTAKIKAAKTGISMAEICRRALAAWTAINNNDIPNETPVQTTNEAPHDQG